MAQAVRTFGALLAAGALAGLAAPAVGQVTPGSQQGLGLTGASIPPLLKKVQADPYRAPSEPACQSIPEEILALDKVLGPDVDGQKTKPGMAHTAVNYVRHAIPYRGWVRFLTRADSKDNALQTAATAGFARRAFLRGLEAHMECASPAAGAKVADISEKLTPVQAARFETAEAAPAVKAIPAAAPGDEIAREMLTPVATTVPAQTSPVAPRPSAPAPRHVVYRLVDTVSGRPIVPDEPTSDDGPAGGAR
jgi:hypothetical protein